MNHLEENPLQDQIANKVIGMKLEEAKVYAEANGMRIRVYKVDGHYRICTRDYRRDRINVGLADDVVIDANIG